MSNTSPFRVCFCEPGSAASYGTADVNGQYIKEYQSDTGRGDSEEILYMTSFGIQALNLLKSNPFDVILMDLAWIAQIELFRKYWDNTWQIGNRIMVPWSRSTIHVVWSISSSKNTFLYPSIFGNLTVYPRGYGKLADTLHRIFR